jgi:exosortase
MPAADSIISKVVLKGKGNILRAEIIFGTIPIVNISRIGQPRNLVWLLLAILYAPILTILYKSRWETIDYTHAYFILPVSLWLAWRKRKILAKLSREESAQPRKTLWGIDLGLFWLGIGMAMFILGWRKDYLFVSSLSVIPVLFGTLSYLYNPQVARALRFPILYLLLMVPPPLGVLDAITIPMRYGTSLVAYLILRSFFLPITHDGLLLSVEGQQLFMGPACSGFRSLITLVSLGLVYVYLSKSSFKKRMVLLVSIIPLALFGNLVRVIILCLIAYYFGEKAASGFFHNFSGMVMFIVALLGLLGLESLLHTWTGKTNE